MSGRPETVARIVAAREALADGDLQYADRLLCDLELDLAPTSDRRSPRPFACPKCGVAWRTEQRLVEHLENVHHEWQLDRAA